MSERLDCVVNFKRMPREPYRSCRLGLILWHLGENNLGGFPLYIAPTGEKLPLVPWKEYQTRRPTRLEIDGWLPKFAGAGAGIPTGRAAGIFVLDSDSDEAEEFVVAKRMPSTVTVITRSDRRHRYLQYPPGFHVANSAGRLAPGLDIRGEGGMVVGAGTRRPDGFVYHYEDGRALGEIRIAEPPDWLIEWLLGEHEKRQIASRPLRQKVYIGQVGPWARKAIDCELARLAVAASGTRNDTLARVSFRLGQLAGGNEADADELRASLCAIADQWTDEHTKSASTIARSFDAGMAYPRQAPSQNFRRRGHPWTRGMRAS